MKEFMGASVIMVILLSGFATRHAAPAPRYPRRISMNIKLAGFLIICTIIMGCTIVSGSAVAIGKTRLPIEPSRVQIYGKAPSKYEEVAIVSAKAGHDFRSEQGIMDSAIGRLKEEAAKVGANGVILQGIQSRSDPTVVTTFGTAAAYGTGGSATASGSSIGIASGGRYGHVKGIAIYVSEDAK